MGDYRKAIEQADANKAKADREAHERKERQQAEAAKNLTDAAIWLDHVIIPELTAAKSEIADLLYIEFSKATASLSGSRLQAQSVKFSFQPVGGQPRRDVFIYNVFGDEARCVHIIRELFDRDEPPVIHRDEQTDTIDDVDRASFKKFLTGRIKKALDKE